jgi:hypothetical protein
MTPGPSTPPAEHPRRAQASLFPALDPADMQRAAEMSDDLVYRYTLTRRWGPGPAIPWVMLNPSTADHQADDATIRRVVGFTRDAGYRACVVLNLFALRATDPVELLRHPDPVGPRNDATIRATVLAHRHASPSDTLARFVAVAWGASVDDRQLAARASEALNGALAGADLRCLGTTRSGQPRHPLYVPVVTPLQPYARPT